MRWRRSSPATPAAATATTRPSNHRTVCHLPYRPRTARIACIAWNRTFPTLYKNIAKITVNSNSPSVCLFIGDKAMPNPTTRASTGLQRIAWTGFQAMPGDARRCLTTPLATPAGRQTDFHRWRRYRMRMIIYTSPGIACIACPCGHFSTSVSHLRGSSICCRSAFLIGTI